MRYRKIDTRIWNDEKFRALDFFAQDLWFYILTNDQTNQTGLYVWRHEHAQADLIPRWRKALQQLVDAANEAKPEMKLQVEDLTGPENSRLIWAYHRAWDALTHGHLISYHEPSRVLLVTRFLKYEPPASSKNVMGWKHILNDLPTGHDHFPQFRESLTKHVDPKKRKSCLAALDMVIPMPMGVPIGMPIPMGRGVSGTGSGTGIKENPVVTKNKRVKKSHPGEAHRKELQALSDHHADLFDRKHVKVVLDDNVKRIIKVLESQGLDACFLIQEGHKLLEKNERFMGWHNAYPPIRMDGKAKRTEPNMEWVERHRSAGERVQKGKGGRDWEKEPFA